MKINPTSRLRFGFMGREDIAHFLELDSDPAVMRYINGGKPTTREQFETVAFPRLYAYRNASKGWGMFSVFEQQSDVFLGWILVRPMNFFSESPQWDNLEIGWRFKQQSWGKGYATEAAKAVLAGVSEQTGVQRFCAIADKDNVASTNVMEKLGMKYVDTRIHQDPLGDSEVVYYQLNLAVTTVGFVNNIRT